LESRDNDFGRRNQTLLVHIVTVIENGPRRYSGMGLPATGKEVSISNMSVFRLAGGKVIERWAVFDFMRMMGQLGILPGVQEQTNKNIVTRYHEQVWNNGRLDLMEEFIAEDFGDDNVRQIPGHNSRDTLKASIGGALKALPDFQITLHDVIANGTKVVTRFTYTATHQGELMGIPATGKKLTVTGATIFRLENARITQFWNFNDNLGLMQQMGVVPAPESD
jgi:steroid delta-isomerase-like uncharacterized protein